MKIFRALIFVGIISLSTCRPDTQTQTQQQELHVTNDLLNYPDLAAKQHFNATAYFHDVWHVVSTFNPHTPSNKSEDKTLCIKFTSQILENGNAREFHTQLDESEPHLYVEYIINLNELQNGVGKYIAQTRTVDKEGHSELPYYPTRITVIDTDYSNYSVEYKCVKLLKDVSCVYFILSRKPYVLEPNVEPILNKLKLKLQDFTLLNKPGCEVA